MAIGATAGRALGLISAIDVVHKPEPDYWRQLVIRIVIELEDTLAGVPLDVICDVLREQYLTFDVDRARAKPLAEIGDPVVIDRADAEALVYRPGSDPVKHRVRALLGQEATRA